MRDVAVTAASSVATVLSLVYVTRLLARGLGPEQFGAYGLSRRLLSTMTSLTSIPLCVGIARYVALAREKRQQYSYLVSGMLLLAVCSLALVGFALLFRRTVTVVIFHSLTYQSVLMASLLLYLAICSVSVVFAYYRGLSKMGQANFWNFVCLALVPLFVARLYYRSGRLDLIVLLTALGTCVAVVPLVMQLSRALSGPLTLRNHLTEMTGYVLPRVPGGLGFAGLMAIGPYLAGYLGSLTGAGYLVIGQSLVSITQTGTESFGLVALPKVASMMAENRSEFLNDRIADITALVVQVGIFITLHLLLWADSIVLIWLGSEYAEAIAIVRLSVLGVVPFLAYSMLRSIVDAVEVRAVNTQNLFIAMFVTAAGSLFSMFVRGGLYGLAVANTLGWGVLGVLTVAFLWRRYKPPSYSARLVSSTAICLALIVPEYALKQVMQNSVSGPMQLAAGAMFGVVAAVVYYFILRRLGIRWTRELEHRIVGSSRSVPS